MLCCVCTWRPILNKLESGFQGTVIENRSGPIEILVSSLGYSEVKIAIQAHPDLVILRNELYDAEES